MFKKAIFHNISIIFYAHTHTFVYLKSISYHMSHYTFKKKKKHNKH